MIGAFESSSTSAIDLVPAGASAQETGGESGRGPAQVNWSGITVPCTKELSVTVITLGAASVTPDEKSLHPASGKANPTAATAAATRPARPRRRRDIPSTSHLTRLILGPSAGPGGWPRAASPFGEELQDYPERVRARAHPAHFPGRGEAESRRFHFLKAL